MTTKYGNFAVSGWCIGCGRNLTPDGRCPNCDAWWASPLVRVGGPLVLATTALLALAIGVLRPQGLPAPVRGAVPAASAPAAASSRRAPSRLPVPPSSVAAPPEPVRAVERAPRDSPRAVTQAEQVRLRLLSAYVDAVIAADEKARAQRIPEARDVPSPGGAGF